MCVGAYMHVGGWPICMRVWGGAYMLVCGGAYMHACVGGAYMHACVGGPICIRVWEGLYACMSVWEGLYARMRVGEPICMRGECMVAGLSMPCVSMRACLCMHVCPSVAPRLQLPPCHLVLHFPLVSLSSHPCRLVEVRHPGWSPTTLTA